MRCEMTEYKFLSKEDQKLQQQYLDKIRAKQQQHASLLIIWNDGRPLQPGYIQQSQDEAAFASYETKAFQKKQSKMI
jgi:hypothetical protein